MASTQTDFLQRREQQIFWAILIAHTALALSFSLGPIFEGPDEIEHYRYVRTLAQTGALPDPYAQIRGEYHQPPLLYLALVPFTWLADGSDFDQIDGRLNPHYPYLVQVPGGDNKNKFIHTRAEAFPYTGSSTARAVHLMRLLSVAAGAGTVLASRAVFRLLWPENAALRLLATGIVAFWPQFIYMSSVISNDSILIFISTLALFLLLWAQHHDPSWRWAAALGVTLGAALLTKISAGLLALPVAAFFVFANRKWRYVLPVGAVTGLAAGWWYIHNWLRYGDPLGTKAAAHTWAFEVIRPGEFALDIALRDLGYTFQSFWARFGSGAVGVEPLYRFFELLTLAALAGLVVCAVRSLFARPAAPASWRADAVIVGSFALGWAGGLSYAGLMWMGNQGRYLLPGIAAWTVLIALGLRALTPKRWHALLATSGVVVMAAIAVICLAAYFVPAYRVLPVPGDIAHPLGYRYGETVELIGTDAAAYTAQPGELIWITLYWRALRPADADLRVALHALDSDLVRRDSLPAAGKLYAPDWQPGMTWADRYVIEVPPDAGRQTVYSFRVGVYDVATGASLPAAGPDGEPAAMVVGGSVILHGLPAQPPPAYRYRFGAGMGLQAPQILQGDEPGRVNLCLAWVALAPMPANYHRFVHALLDDGTRASLGADGLIGGARYPTSAWLPGEKIEECIPVDARALSPGSWRLGIGAYDYESGARLPAQSDQGEILDGDTVVTDESP